uniref:Uncharacterized protein n=1 Tax=Cannabis sativa TaxID=3483 RepID=A0A803QHZ1_CANSA
RVLTFNSLGPFVGTTSLSQVVSLHTIDTKCLDALTAYRTWRFALTTTSWSLRGKTSLRPSSEKKALMVTTLKVTASITTKGEGVRRRKDLPSSPRHPPPPTPKNSNPALSVQRPLAKVGDLNRTRRHEELHVIDGWHPEGESKKGLSRKKNLRGRSEKHESIRWGKTIIGETSCSFMKGLQPKNLVQGNTALAPPSQEKRKQKVSPLNHDGESHNDGMRGVLLKAPSELLGKSKFHSPTPKKG